jgi:hypothetical protein
MIRRCRYSHRTYILPFYTTNYLLSSQPPDKMWICLLRSQRLSCNPLGSRKASLCWTTNFHRPHQSVVPEFLLNLSTHRDACARKIARLRHILSIDLIPRWNFYPIPRAARGRRLKFSIFIEA